MGSLLSGTRVSPFYVLVPVAVAAALTLLVLAGTALAATFTVTKRADTADGSCTPQDCSLREAVIAANETDDPDIIRVPQGTYTLTIPQGTEANSLGGDPTVGDLDILDDPEDESVNEVEIRGAGARETVIQGGEEFDDRIFDIPGTFNLSDPPEATPSDAVVEIEGVRISNGNTETIGGGIRNVGTLTLRESTLSNNTAAIGGGGIRNDLDFTLVRSTVSNNTVNDSESSSGVGGGGGIFNNDSAALINSTVSNNESDTFGGGITNFVTSSDGSLTVTNATINANSAPVGANVADGLEGGPTTQGEGGPSTLFENTIVSNAREGENCAGAFTSGGNNIDDDGSCAFTERSDIRKDPRLGPLNNNGGPTNTHALRDRSPAIDAADDRAAPPTDQRGVRRPQDGDDRGRAVSDIGAFERKATGGGGNDDDSACTITGTRRNDVLRGTAKDDVICGLGGNDVIVGLGGDDLLQGDAGNDEIDAGPDADRVYGGRGDDAIDVSDGSGRDLADGESGTDSCTVDPGDAVRSCRAT